MRVWDTGAAAGERSWTLPALKILDVARDGRRVLVGERTELLGAPPLPADGRAHAVSWSPSAPLSALREVPVEGGLVTVALADRLTVRRWTLARGQVEALFTDSPFCLDPAWRRIYLHETAAEARDRHLACRTRIQAPAPP